MPEAAVDAIYRYPVKGLSPERLARTVLVAGETLAGDRAFAIENGPSGFVAEKPSYLPKSRFLMLMRNERLARLATRYDEASGVLSIATDGSEAARGDLSTAEGRRAIEDFFAAFSAGELRGPPRLLRAPGHSFSDVAAKVVSIINLASVAAIENLVGASVDPLRFRGNVHVGGWPAWHEFDLVGKELAVGAARLRVVKRITRCAATNVDPVTGMRDLAIPRALEAALGHDECGVYAEVTGGGEIAAGSTISVRDRASRQLAF